MTSKQPQTSAERREAAPQDMAEFWRDHCLDCGHPKHPLDACGEIVGGTFEPEYCGCAAEIHHMAAAIRQYQKEAAAPASRLAEAERLLRELTEAVEDEQGVGWTLSKDRARIARAFLNDAAGSAETGKERDEPLRHRDRG